MKIHTPRLIDGTGSSIGVGKESRENVPRAYPEPLQDAERVAGTVCYYQKRLNVFLDGEREEQAPSHFSK